MIDHGFRLYAHRGSRLKAPENSLAAFRIALHEGANALEMDVRATRDRHLVVIHDADGHRVAGEKLAVAAMPLAEIRQWRLQAPAEHHPLAPASCSIPTIDEVLEEFPGVHLSVDIKPNRPELAHILVQRILAHEAADQVTVASFHHRVVAQARALGYPGPTTCSRREVALLRFAPLTRSDPRMLAGRAVQIPCHAGPFRLDGDAFLGRCRRLGLRVDYWVVNDLEQARNLIARGATGIVTDNPASMACLL